MSEAVLNCYISLVYIISQGMVKMSKYRLLIAGCILMLVTTSCAQRIPAEPPEHDTDSEITDIIEDEPATEDPLGRLVEIPQPEPEEAEDDMSVSEPAEKPQTVPVRVYQNLRYAETTNTRQRLDIYVPESPSYVPMPVVIYIHGGSWSSGSRSELPAVLHEMLGSQNYAVVSVGYRLTNEAQWPAQLHDVKAAIRWVRARAEQYGFDPQRIALWGDEAGGHLALIAGLTNNAQDMAGTLGQYTHIRNDVAAVVNFGGVSNINALLDQRSSIDRAAATSPEARLVGGLLRDNNDVASAASPIHYIRPAAPPVLSVHSTEDSVIPYEQARALHRRLKDAETEQYLVTVLGDHHDNYPPQAYERAWNFIDRVLRGRNVAVDTAVIELRE